MKAAKMAVNAPITPSKLIPFAFDELLIRTTYHQNEPWFVISDVCKALEISNPRMAATRLENDSVSSTDVVNSIGKRRQAPITNEYGLYQLIFQSRKQSAKVFQRWVFREVLPTLRKTGSYGHPAPEQDTHPAVKLVKELIETGSSPDEACRLARHLTPRHSLFATSKDAAPSQASPLHEEMKELLALLTPGQEYTLQEIIDLLPPTSRLIKGTKAPSRRSAVGKLMERARRHELVTKIRGRHSCYHIQSNILPFSAEG